MVDASTKMFTGHERDQETGVDYMMARYYGNSLPRFFSPDPLGGALGDPQSRNRYAYVRNSPINLTDPRGLYWAPGTAPPRSPIDGPWGVGGTDDPSGPPCALCKEMEPTETDREDVGFIPGSETLYDEDNPNDPARADAYNCHSFTFHDKKGDPTDNRNANAPPNWDNFGDDDLETTMSLAQDEPNRVGDIVAYGFDTDGNEVLDLKEVKHTGRVNSVDSQGNTLKVIGKFGEAAIHVHHPAARKVEANYGNMRRYFRD